MNSLERRGILAKYPRMNAPLQVGCLGVILTFATPLCCAIFEQMASIPVNKLEPDVVERVRNSNAAVQHLYYNKGL